MAKSQFIGTCTYFIDFFVKKNFMIIFSKDFFNAANQLLYTDWFNLPFDKKYLVTVCKNLARFIISYHFYSAHVYGMRLYSLAPKPS